MSTADTTPTAQSPSSEVVERARALGPAIRKRAEAAETNRTISAEAAADFVAVGIARILVPAAFGGAELGLGTWLDACIEIGRADAAHSWCASLYAHHPHYLAQFPEQAQRAVWSYGPDELIVATLTPTSKLAEVDGGFRVWSEIPYLSGINHASWVIVAGMAPALDGPPDWTMFLVPRGAFTIRDTWHTVGMRGTGSNTVIVDDVFVPHEHTLRVNDMIEGTAPGGRLHASPIYRAPWATYGPLTFLGPMLGAARGALEEYRDWTVSRISLFGESVARYSSIQYKVGRIAADLDAAELLMRRCVAVAESDTPPSGQVRARCYRDQSRASQLIVDAVDLVMSISGAGGFAESSRLQRAWRDVHFAASHVVLNPEVAFTGWGRFEFGLERSPDQKFY